MTTPESHLRYHRERHADLLLDARSGTGGEVREDASLASKHPGVRHLA
jgi:hypothetical protein